MLQAGVPSLGTYLRRTNRMRGRKLQQRNARLLRENPLCVACQAEGRIREAVEVDHTIALAEGGGDHRWNLQGLCMACHREKTAGEASARGRGGRSNSETSSAETAPRRTQVFFNAPGVASAQLSRPKNWGCR